MNIKKFGAAGMAAMTAISGMAMPAFAMTESDHGDLHGADQYGYDLILPSDYESRENGAPTLGYSTKDEMFFDYGSKTASSMSDSADFATAVDVEFAADQQTADNMHGVDPTQDKNTVYEKADDLYEQTEVYASVPSSDIMIYIPKTLVLDGYGKYVWDGETGDMVMNDNHSAEYIVAVTGNVDPSVDVLVTPDASLGQMVNQGNTDIKYDMVVTQEGTRFNGDDILMELGKTVDGLGIASYATKTIKGTVESEIERAGIYQGTFNFRFDLAAEEDDAEFVTQTDAAAIEAANGVNP